ncbi:MAG: FRG domain-containing protein [Sulfurimonas sp.]|nr:FRG domain-containing protein [Sulfurimonas sp.]
MKEIKIQSVIDLIEDIKKNDSKLWFRGQINENNKEWDLLPSAYRNDPLLESETLNHFRLKSPAMYKNCPSTKEYSKWLSLMQHFGLPTRLLDWTESPLVALFFALDGTNKQQNATIWALEPGKLNQSMHGENIIDFLDSERINDTLAQEAFERVDNKYQHILAVTLTYNNDRLDRQHSQFTIHGTTKPLNEFENAYEYLTKYIINVKHIDNLKNELSILDIRRSKLFPDLQNLSKELSEIVII